LVPQREPLCEISPIWVVPYSMAPSIKQSNFVPVWKPVYEILLQSSSISGRRDRWKQTVNVSLGLLIKCCTTLLIDLTLGKCLQILCERRGAMWKSVIFDAKSAISLKRSNLEPTLLQSIYMNSHMGSLSIGEKFGDLAWSVTYVVKVMFREKFSHTFEVADPDLSIQWATCMVVRLRHIELSPKIVFGRVLNIT